MSVSTKHGANTTAAPDIFISKEILDPILLLLYSVLCQIINVFGIGTNIINIIIFAKQGFKEAINVSLLGLSISDFGCLVTVVWINICLTPAFQDADLPFDPVDSYYLTSAMPHFVFTRVTSSITALIMVERCLCVTMPLKVKNIFTSRVVAITIACLYVLLIACVSPVYFVYRYSMIYIAERNRTILGLVATGNRELVEQVSFTINNIFVPFSALIIIIVSMVVMVTSLQKQARWRNKSSVSTKVDSTSDRDKKIAKMVVMISTLFVVCFAPSGALFIVLILVPELSYKGKYEAFAICDTSAPNESFDANHCFEM